MRTTVEYEISKFPDYDLYFFYVRRKLDGEWCWVWDEDKLLEEEAYTKYPPSKYEWVECTRED